MPEYSDLEKAISTLVSQFHSASADKSPELKPEEFKGLLSSQMPSLKLPMDEIMRKMGVADGEGISFSKFWNLIQSVASSQHSLLSSQRGTSCGCVLL